MYFFLNIFLQIPIFGSFGQATDPFYQQRLVLGSVRGTIMELGTLLTYSVRVFEFLFFFSQIFSLKITIEINELVVIF